MVKSCASLQMLSRRRPSDCGSSNNCRPIELADADVDLPARMCLTFSRFEISHFEGCLRAAAHRVCHFVAGNAMPLPELLKLFEVKLFRHFPQRVVSRQHVTEATQDG